MFLFVWFFVFWIAPNYVMMIIPQIIYRMEYNKTKAKGYTLPYDTPYQQHMKKVKDITSNVSSTQTGCTFNNFFTES